jgi:hypothetical protein
MRCKWFFRQLSGTAFFLSVIWFSAGSQAATIDFEDLLLSPQSQWYGPDPSGQLVHQTFPYEDDMRAGKFTSGGADFNNVFSEMYYSWVGWAYSNLTYDPGDYVPGDYNPGDGSNGNLNPVPTGWTSQYYAVPGGDAGGSSSSGNYALAYMGWDTGPTVNFSAPVLPVGAYFTNNNFAYYSMLEGDPPGGFAKKFSAEDEDFLKLTITGKDADGAEVGSLVFYLADFRDPLDRTDNPRTDNYIIDQWTWVDLSTLGGNVKRLEFALSSSDSGLYGINTPTYFAMDNLIVNVVPEPHALMLLTLAAAGFFLKPRRRDPALRSG